MKIAVTGGGGFIGRHVLKYLLKQPVEIITITRDAKRLADLHQRTRILEMDIAHPPTDCYEQMGCPDVLIHLAWDGLPNYKSLHHFETELPRQYLFLKTMIEAGLPSLLVAGTCFEYGMQSGPLSADMQTLPSNPYGYAKDALRKQLQFLQAIKPFNLTWARLFYMYGEGQPPSSLFPKLKDSILAGDKIFNMSGGEQLRDYLSVEEVANQITHLAMTADNVGPINICSGKPVSVRILVERWIQENNWDIELNLGYYPYPDYESMAFWGASSGIENVTSQHKTKNVFIGS